MINLLAPDLHCLRDIFWDIFSGSWGTMWVLSLGLCRGIAAAASAPGLTQLSHLKIPSNASPTGSAELLLPWILGSTGGIQVTLPTQPGHSTGHSAGMCLPGMGREGAP